MQSNNSSELGQGLNEKRGIIKNCKSTSILDLVRRGIYVESFNTTVV